MVGVAVGVHKLRASSLASSLVRFTTSSVLVIMAATSVMCGLNSNVSSSDDAPEMMEE